jgi:hypothetical protein
LQKNNTLQNSQIIVFFLNIIFKNKGILMTIFYNAFHSPLGAHSSFTLGCKGQTGGLGLELGGPACENIYSTSSDHMQSKITHLMCNFSFVFNAT